MCVYKGDLKVSTKVVLVQRLSHCVCDFCIYTEWVLHGVSLLISLLITGTIWSRYSLVIDPINYNLFAVNLFVAATGYFQLYRIWQ